MTKHKKVFAGLLILCMLLSFMPVTFAAEAVSYSLQGDAMLFAPPAEAKSVVPYKLMKTTTSDDGASAAEEIAGAELSLSGDSIPQGVSLSENKTAVVLDGSTIKNGKFTVTATKGSETASKAITVFDGRMYFDFEDQVTGAAGSAKAKKLSDNTVVDNELLTNYSGKIGENNGNKYYGSDGWGYRADIVPYKVGYSDWVLNTKYITVAFDVKKSQYNSNATIMVENKTGLTLKWESGTNKLVCANEARDFVLSQTEWKRIYVLFDYYAKEYTVYAGERAFGPFTMNVNDTTKYIHTITFQNSVDNIAFYSGKPVVQRTGTISGDSTLFAPPSGVRSAVSYTATDANGNKIPGMKWSVKGSGLAGVSVEESMGRVILDGTGITAPGSFTLTAKNGEYVAEKVISLADVRIYEDFEGQTSGEVFNFYPKKLSGENYNGVRGSGSTAVIASDEATGNQYVQNVSGTIYFILRWATDAKVPVIKDSGVTTLSYKMNNNGSFSDGNKISVDFTSGKFRYNKLETVGKLAEGWTEVRFVIDFTDKERYPNGKYTVYVDDALAAKDVAMGAATSTEREGYITDPTFTGSMDDFAYYSGETIVEDYLTVDGAAYTGGSVLSSGEHTVKARLGGLAQGKKMFFMAHYKDGALQKVDVLTSELEDVAVRLDKINGGTVKVFLWDEDLMPREITSIVKEVN